MNKNFRDTWDQRLLIKREPKAIVRMVYRKEAIEENVDLQSFVQRLTNQLESWKNNK